MYIMLENAKEAKMATKKSSPERAAPGSEGSGEFYRIVVRPKDQFVTFRNQDIGDKGGIERLAGQRADGTWDTQAWLISKGIAHVEGGKLVGDSADARKIISEAGIVSHKEGDIFGGSPRRDVPESEKPTPAMKRARAKNIKKAQAARKLD